ncbi:hypothetical protein [Brevibacillus dissolubilis]|uniref:hypothetical protein n=1 Tax=Brevibacillus dissolubilis TaxID=1844116 RepID=UPI001117707A|nr:hypothetical protein [Brevibacillus dissolubilis]
MANTVHLMKEKKEFEKAYQFITKVFDAKKRLPEQVFHINFQKTLVFDFDMAMSESFWMEIERLKAASKYTEVFLAVLEPDPVDYYLHEFHYFNWCCFPDSTTPEECWDTLEQGPAESPADAILYNSEIVVWLPTSMKWAIWGERKYGVCILAFNDDSGIDANIFMHNS